MVRKGLERGKLKHTETELPAEEAQRVIPSCFVHECIPLIPVPISVKFVIR